MKISHVLDRNISKQVNKLTKTFVSALFTINVMPLCQRSSVIYTIWNNVFRSHLYTVCVQKQTKVGLRHVSSHKSLHPQLFFFSKQFLTVLTSESVLQKNINVIKCLEETCYLFRVLHHIEQNKVSIFNQILIWP